MAWLYSIQPQQPNKNGWGKVKVFRGATKATAKAPKIFLCKVTSFSEYLNVWESPKTVDVDDAFIFSAGRKTLSYLILSPAARSFSKTFFLPSKQRWNKSTSWNQEKWVAPLFFSIHILFYFLWTCIIKSLLVSIFVRRRCLLSELLHTWQIISFG